MESIGRLLHEAAFFDSRPTRRKSKAVKISEEPLQLRGPAVTRQLNLSLMRLPVLQQRGGLAVPPPRFTMNCLRYTEVVRVPLGETLAIAFTFSGAQRGRVADVVPLSLGEYGQSKFIGLFRPSWTSIGTNCQGPGADQFIFAARRTRVEMAAGVCLANSLGKERVLFGRASV